MNATWIAVVEYKEDLFDKQEGDSDYESSEYEISDNESDIKDQNYDQIDKHELADILGGQYRVDQEDRGVSFENNTDDKDPVEEDEEVENRRM